MQNPDAFMDNLNILAEDPYRPTYHFTCPLGYALPFDPNGMLLWKGRYHMFYICQDEKQAHFWGHASSRDCIHWRHHRPAMFPDSPLSGERIYSGNAFVNLEGVPTIAYYGYNLGVCLATSTDDMLEHWAFWPGNPVVPIPPAGSPGHSVHNLYDAHVWIENGIYKMLIGGKPGEKGTRDTAHLYESADLNSWQYVRQFYTPREEWTHPVEETACPDFFPLGNKHALLCISHMFGARMYIGGYYDGVFTPEQHVRLNHPGGSMFAPESVCDEHGNRIVMAWATDANLAKDETTQHSTSMALPREISLDAKGRLEIKPLNEINNLLYNRHILDSVTLTDEVHLLPEEFFGNIKKIRVQFKQQDEGQTGVKVLCSADGAEETAIYIDFNQQQLVMDVSKSRDDPDYTYYNTMIELEPGNSRPITQQIATVEIRPKELITLDIYIDRSIVEVFYNDRETLTQRIYPIRRDAVQAALMGKGSKFVLLEAWDVDRAMMF